MIDLHCHSRASDGSHPPDEVVALAAGAGVECLALTDHDTVDGLDAAQAAASDHGIHLIPGIEISAAWESRTLHIVGLNIDPANPALTDAGGTVWAADSIEALARLAGLPAAQLAASVAAYNDAVAT